MGAPDTIGKLRERGIDFRHRPAAHDCVVRCPACGARMLLHESKAWHFCTGRRCDVEELNFDQVLSRLEK
jgi:hypothetical protein